MPIFFRTVIKKELEHLYLQKNPICDNFLDKTPTV
jgi:hypothetical protein